MARKKVTSNGNGSTLKALYTGDTKNFNKLTVISEGHVGGIYFPIKEDIEATTIQLTLVLPKDKSWESEMRKLIKNTSNPKALAALNKCQ